MIRKFLMLAAVSLTIAASAVLVEQAQAGPGQWCHSYPNGQIHCN